MTSPILPAFHIVVAPPTTAVITVPFDFDLFDSKCHCRLNYHCIFKIFLTNSINCIKQLCDFIFSRIKLCRIFIHHYSTDKSCPLMPYRPLNSTRLLPTMDDRLKLYRYQAPSCPQKREISISNCFALEFERDSRRARISSKKISYFNLI